MPEGDTIHRAAAALHRALAGHDIVRFESVFPALTRVHDDHPLTSMSVERVQSSGKHLLMHFSGGFVLRTHMRMHGSWHIYRPGERWRQNRRNMRVLVATADFEAVGFNIPVAEFIKVDPKHALAKHRVLGKLGPDALAADFDRDEAIRRLRSRPAALIADALLNQQLLAGIGNVFKSEVLFACGINPFVNVAALDRQRARAPGGHRAEAVASQRRRFVNGPGDLHWFPAHDRPRQPRGAALGLRPRPAALPPLRNRHRRQETRSGCEVDLLVSGMSEVLIWLALLGGTAAAAARVVRPLLCPARLADGAGDLPARRTAAAPCSSAVRASALLGIPNATLGLALYALLAAGLLLHVPSWQLLTMTFPAVAMSAFLGRSLIVNGHQCRICWTGHISNAVLFVVLLARVLRAA